MIALLPLADDLHGGYDHAHGIGVWFTVSAEGLGQVHVSESVYVACEIGIWLAAVLLGLLTAREVMP